MYPLQGNRLRRYIVSNSSRKNLLYHLTMDISKAEVTPRMTVGQALMINAQKVKDSGLEIMDADSIAAHIFPKFIACPMDHATLDPCPGKPRTINP